MREGELRAGSPAVQKGGVDMCPLVRFSRGGGCTGRWSEGESSA